MSQRKARYIYRYGFYFDSSKLIIFLQVCEFTISFYSLHLLHFERLETFFVNRKTDLVNSQTYKKLIIFELTK